MFKKGKIFNIHNQKHLKQTCLISFPYIELRRYLCCNTVTEADTDTDTVTVTDKNTEVANTYNLHLQMQ